MSSRGRSTNEKYALLVAGHSVCKKVSFLPRRKIWYTSFVCSCYTFGNPTVPSCFSLACAGCIQCRRRHLRVGCRSTCTANANKCLTDCNLYAPSWDLILSDKYLEERIHLNKGSSLPWQCSCICPEGPQTRRASPGAVHTHRQPPLAS